MPWKECSAVSCREEFVVLARTEEANVSKLCRHFGVSRRTGYKWLGRFARTGRPGLLDRSRRPRSSPERTDRWGRATRAGKTEDGVLEESATGSQAARETIGCVTYVSEHL